MITSLFLFQTLLCFALGVINYLSGYSPYEMSVTKEVFCAKRERYLKLSVAGMFIFSSLAYISTTF